MIPLATQGSPRLAAARRRHVRSHPPSQRVPPDSCLTPSSAIAGGRSASAATTARNRPKQARRFVRLQRCDHAIAHISPHPTTADVPKRRGRKPGVGPCRQTERQSRTPKPDVLKAQRAGGWHDPLMTRESSRTPPEMSSSELWPPDGFSTYYTVTERLDGHDDLTFDLVLPGTFAEIDLATVRIGRHGGPNADDLQFRSELYRRVGAVTVAAGNVEMAMKRLLLVLTSSTKAHFATVDEPWSTLHRKLLRQCDGSDKRRRELAKALAWSEGQGIKRRRDNVIHAGWWDFAECQVRRARFARGSNGTTICASLTDLDEDVSLLTEYAERLDRLLGNDWIIARLPGPVRVRRDVTFSPLPHSQSA